MEHKCQAPGVILQADVDIGDTERSWADSRTTVQLRSRTGASPCTAVAGSSWHCTARRSDYKTKWYDAELNSLAPPGKGPRTSREGGEGICSAPLAWAKVF